MSSATQNEPQSEGHRHAGENQLIWTVWLTYGAFYFCRTNISAAVPGLKDSVADGGAGLSPESVGFILASLKLTYALGQLVNGQLSERLSPRKMLAVGMLGSAALNVLFGFGASAYFLLFVWACNGGMQSLGWTPCVRVLANWIPPERRGHAIGLVGTGSQLTAVLTFIVAGTAAEHFGWRGALFVPAAILVAASVVMLLFLEERPEDSAAAGPASSASRTVPEHSAGETIRLTLMNRNLWLLGISLGLLNACRYGFLDWGLTHLKEVQETGVGKAALKYAVLPTGAIAGAYLSGWVTDRFFNGRRAPVICVLLILLGILSLQYDAVARTSVGGTMGLLVCIGFCIYGPQVLLVGTAPADLARRGTSAAAAGFVNFMGYIGAAMGDIVTGYYVNPEHGGWQIAIYIWAGWAFGAAFAVALLWNSTHRNEQSVDS